MSHRPINKKAANRVRKAMRNELPAYFDVVQWLINRKHAKTRKEAEQIILAKRVRSGSHTIGVETREVFTPLTALQIARGVEPKLEEKEVVQTYVPVNVRDQLIVLSA